MDKKQSFQEALEDLLYREADEYGPDENLTFDDPQKLKAALTEFFLASLPERPDTVDVWGNWYGMSMNRDTTAGAIHALDQVRLKIEGTE